MKTFFNSNLIVVATEPLSAANIEATPDDILFTDAEVDQQSYCEALGHLQYSSSPSEFTFLADPSVQAPIGGGSLEGRDEGVTTLLFVSNDLNQASTGNSEIDLTAAIAAHSQDEIAADQQTTPGAIGNLPLSTDTAIAVPSFGASIIPANDGPVTTPLNFQFQASDVNPAISPHSSAIGASYSGATLDAAAFANAATHSIEASTSSSVGSQGATSTQVQQALDESGLSVNGAGIKVGVLSDSFNDLGGAASDEADGALPSASNIQVLEDLPSGGSDEGRAMMQIVHDIAPDASLAFYTAFESEQDFANGILALAAAGCKVICDDVSYFDEPFFQNGVVAQAIQTVEAEGVTYISAAGNDASNGYQAAWTPISGVFDGTALYDTESFSGNLTQTITVAASSTETVPLLLEWNQAYGAATSDLEILVFKNGRLVGTATNRTSGEPSNPWVDYTFTSSGTYQIAIENLSGPNPGLIKEIAAGDGLPVTISGANAGTVYGHAMTPGVIAAGAISAADTPAFGVNPPVSESFSSSGAGTELLFANNGTALSSPDALNPVAVSGLDDISTTVAGNLSDFYGTSAASASLAGVAALMLSENPSLTPTQVERIMEETALPVSNSAVGGAGLVQVDPAVEAASLSSHLIQTDGSTSLSELGNDYFVISNGGDDPLLKYAGDLVVAGQFGNISPIGAIQTASGYDIAWRVPGTEDFTFWTTGSNGNYTSNLTGWVTGDSFAVESLETIFGQDLNGDGTIGVTSSLIQADGSTSLLNIADNYYLYTSGSGPTLAYGGSPVTAGEFGNIVPVGAVKTSTGYDVAWQVPGTEDFTFWTTDANGNYTSNLTGWVTGNSFAVESLETIFGQDLNGDGTIGVTSSLIQTDGSTSLLNIANNYYLYTNGSGPALSYGGTTVTAAEFGEIAPVGAIKTPTGYDIAWQVPDTEDFTFWTVDGSGNYTSNLTGWVIGTDATLKSLEATFYQDFNGDGYIDSPAAVIDVTGDVVLRLSTVAQPATIEAGATLELTGADSSSVTFQGSTGSLVFDHSSMFTGEVFNFKGTGNTSSSDQFDLRDIAFGAGTTESFNGSSSGGTLTVEDAQDHTANIQLSGNYINSTFTLSSDGSGGTIVIDPPIPEDQFLFKKPNVASPVKPTQLSWIAESTSDSFVFRQAAGYALIHLINDGQSLYLEDHENNPSASMHPASSHEHHFIII